MGTGMWNGLVVLKYVGFICSRFDLFVLSIHQKCRGIREEGYNDPWELKLRNRELSCCVGVCWVYTVYSHYPFI